MSLFTFKELSKIKRLIQNVLKHDVKSCANSTLKSSTNISPRIEQNIEEHLEVYLFLKDQCASNRIEATQNEAFHAAHFYRES